ncbi:MAG: dTDP-4-dehydrorhamnose 3,5-epimerase [Bacteroidaceae bacterium]|nr:dTDP-4-dehydrorhamnose 3,5-epimerase [Bacteroidaceae bacterium]
MKFLNTIIDGVYIIDPDVHVDSRGHFYESFNQAEFESAIGNIHFVQDNESYSHHGVIRGLHYQRPPYTQAKLARCVRGKILDVAVDLRRKSKTYGTYVAVELSEVNHRQLFIPKGCAHGFSVLSESAIFQYKCDEYYHPEAEIGFAWDDKQVNVNWQVDMCDVVLADKDKSRMLFRELPLDFV